MTEDEIIKVAKIMLTADCWCSNCNSDLLEQLRDAFPEHRDAVIAVERDKAALEKRFKEAELEWSYRSDTSPSPKVWMY